MPIDRSERLARALAYLSRRGGNVKIEEFLGGGIDGDVWRTSVKTAVKVFMHERGYYNERDAYQRLADWGVTKEIEGFWIPEMQGFDDELMVVEMDVMNEPPYILDFGKVRIDRPPDFSEEVLREQEEHGRELFEHNWPAVKRLLAALESYQIYYLDPKPGNITFPDMR
jgi:hypothetical protein